MLRNENLELRFFQDVESRSGGVFAFCGHVMHQVEIIEQLKIPQIAARDGGEDYLPIGGIFREVEQQLASVKKEKGRIAEIGKLVAQASSVHVSLRRSIGPELIECF